MLPKNIETPRLRYLQNIVEASTADDLATFPMLNEKDYVLIGGFVVLFSYIDLNLRRAVEVYDHAGLLLDPWKGRTGKLDASEVAAAIQSMACWDPAGRAALASLEELRSMRNLIAHFAIRRFPSDDAFLFIAKSARDFKKQFGTEPKPGALLTAVTEVELTKQALRHVEHVQNWLALATKKLEDDLSPLLRADAAE